MHCYLTDDALTVVAGLAGEDVAIFFGREEATPATLSTWTGAELFIAFETSFGGLVQPSGDVSRSLFEVGRLTYAPYVSSLVSFLISVSSSTSSHSGQQIAFQPLLLISDLRWSSQQSMQTSRPCFVADLCGSLGNRLIGTSLLQVTHSLRLIFLGLPEKTVFFFFDVETLSSSSPLLSLRLLDVASGTVSCNAPSEVAMVVLLGCCGAEVSVLYCFAIAI